MKYPSLLPAGSPKDLRQRVDHLLSSHYVRQPNFGQLSLSLDRHHGADGFVNPFQREIKDLLDLISYSIPDGGLYLFGGILRDLALFGKRGFNSDLDLVIDGDWSHLLPLFEINLKAERNKFGGFRLECAGWPIDIWHARDTWACKNGLVEYKGVGSLLRTTILNWDAILMDWRTKDFVHLGNYFEQIRTGTMDIVLAENPSPLRMAARVFRFLSIKNCREITHKTLTYLSHAANSFSYEELVDSERVSYGNSAIEKTTYDFFKCDQSIETTSLAFQKGLSTSLMEKQFVFS